MSESTSPTHPFEVLGYESFRFRLVHLVYAVTLLACWLATFGVAGIPPAVLVFLFWGSIFPNRSRRRAFWLLSGTLLLLSFPINCVLPSFGPRTSRRMVCRYNLKQIALALHNYHDVYGSFPPAYIADKHGKPMHSWRVLLLPFLEERQLYQQYDFSEPWNGPHNSKLLDQAMTKYRCTFDADPSGKHTSYFAVVGPRTAWPGATTMSIGQLKDSTSATVLLVECNHRSVAWTEPTDLGLDEAINLLHGNEAHGGHQWQDFLQAYESCGRHVASVDAAVFYVAPDFGQANWTSLLVADDGSPVQPRDAGSSDETVVRLRVDNCLRLCALILVSLFPLPWVWWHPDGTRINALPAEGSVK